MQAQTALAAGNCATAAELIKDALRSAVPDDWAAYVLLFCCSLPRTAWPCEHAGNGIIGVEGGVGHLRERLLKQEFWQALEGPQSEAAVKEVVSDLQQFLTSMIALVRPALLPPEQRWMSTLWQVHGCPAGGFGCMQNCWCHVLFVCTCPIAVPISTSAASIVARQ